MKNIQQIRPTIGFIHNYLYEGTIHDYFFNNIIRGIYAAACKNDCNLLLDFGVSRTIWHEQTRPDSLTEYQVKFNFVPISKWKIDGFIVTDADAYGYNDLFELVENGFPVVGLLQRNILPNVNCDDSGGIYKGIEHLVGHGHHIIAFIGEYEDNVKKQYDRRLSAYRKAVRDFGLEDNTKLIVYGNHDRDNSKSAMKALLDSGIKFTAVVASDDNSAIGAMEAIKEAGLRIPEDIAVVGFDDTYDAMVQNPSLTTIRQQKFEAGYQSVELLLKRISEGMDCRESREIPVSLIVRESCGCKPYSEHPDIFNCLGFFSDEMNICRENEKYEDVISGFVEEMAFDIIRNTEYLSYESIQDICRNLIRSFSESLEKGNPELFNSTLRQVIEEIDGEGDDICIINHTVISLKKITLYISESGKRLEKQIEDMLDRAMLLISESAMRQHRKHIMEKNAVTEQLGVLSACLMSAVDESQIFRALEDCIPMFNIKRMDIVFFNTEGDNSETQSFLYRIPERWHKPYPVKTGEYPALELFPKSAPYRLALFPLVIGEENIGYVVFDADNIWPCSSIVNELATAIRGARLYREAVAGRKLAEESDRIKSKFLSMVSHELRTPLYVISSLSEMLVRGREQGKFTLPVEYCRDFEQIFASAQHLDSLISDVLDMTQSEAGRLKLNADAVNIAEVIKEVQGMTAGMAESKGLRLTTGFPDEIPRAWGDRIRIRQVLLNLVSNAIKFTEQGSVSIKAEANPTEIKVIVSDTGVGIPLLDQKLIFEDFHKSKRTSNEGYAGLGLGLSIAKRLAEMHNGAIGVCSSGKIGKGAAFFFTLPIVNEDKCKLEKINQKYLDCFPNPHEMEKESSLNSCYLMKPDGKTELVRAFKKMKPYKKEELILIVDDDPEILDIHERLIKAELPSYRVQTASNGRDALEMMWKETPDLVLLDLMMPGLDGFGVLEEMQKVNKSRDIPVIVLTGQILTEEEMLRLNQGVAVVLKKGVFNVQETLEHIEEALSKSKNLGSEKQRVVRKAMAYIHEHYKEQINLDDIADFVHITKRHLTRCFREEIGITPIVYLNRYRINQAKILLKKTRENVAEVAFEVGFLSSSYFSRVFLKETGILPNVYRLSE